MVVGIVEKSRLPMNLLGLCKMAIAMIDDASTENIILSYISALFVMAKI